MVATREVVHGGVRQTYLSSYENSTDRGLIAGPTGVDMKDNGKTGICTDGVFFIMPTEANIKEIG